MTRPGRICRATPALVGAHVLLAVILAAASSQFPASARLDDARVRDALVFGENRRPEPYLLYPGRGPRTATVAVYTPFVRVALAAHTAARRGERLSVDGIPPWILESDVHVVVRPESTMMAAELFPEDPSLTRTPITRIVLAQNERPPVYDGIAPKWMTTDLSYLDAIGGSPFTDAVAAAAFDAEVIAQSFAVYGFWQTGIHSIPTHGLLNANEVRTWK